MKFPILYIEFKKIQDAFELLPGKQIKKIVFQFEFNEEGENNQPTLTGYVAKQQGIFTPSTPVLTLLKSTAIEPVSLPIPLDLGNIEFSRTEFEDLQNPQKYLLFIPLKYTKIQNSNSVTYKTDWSENLASISNIDIMAIGDELNPSPPKNPVL